MARRRKGNSVGGVISLLMVVLIAGGAGRLLEAIAGHEYAVFGGIFALVAVALVVMAAVNHFTKKDEHRAIEAAILKACDQSRDVTLARNKVKLTYTDKYGLVDCSKWNKELDKFIINFVAPHIGYLASKPEYSPHIRSIIDGRCDDIIANGALRLTATDIRNGLDYEVFVGDILKGHGWDVSVTPASGDQGADVIARRGPETVVIQCKFYTGAVGNKAVQEVAAARVHYGATQAAVVSKSGFTASARQLAATNDVALLHHDELSTL